MTDDIKVTFIIPENCLNENECSEDMHLAFTACEQHCSGGLQAKWVHESQYDQFEGLTKRDVFVMSQFEGSLFEKLKATKCLLVGPRCLACSLTEGVAIPAGPEPVFSVAMRGLVVTASGLSKHQKENIKKKVFWMGGLYSPVLSEDTTHLVSDTVLSDKYIKSVEKGLPIMSETWVDAVFEASLQQNINGSSQQFNCHKLPAFANLQVTTSGISKKEKQMIMKLINDNGGTFSGAFQSETTDVVIMNKDGIGSEKYKAALEYGKAVVLAAWVRDSAAKGVALPMRPYSLHGASTSSPLAEHRLPDMSLNFSRITNVRPPSNFVDETRANDHTNVSSLSSKMKLSQKSSEANDTSMDKDDIAEFEALDMSSVKRAGPIFDGFCIYLVGLPPLPRDRASALVSRAGGVRQDQPHLSTTHVVAATLSHARAALSTLQQGVPIVSPRWLLRCLKEQKALPEAEFQYNLEPSTPVKRSAPPSAASPMSRRNLQLLRPPDPLPPPRPTATTSVQDELVNHYLSQPMPEPEPVRTPPADRTDFSTLQDELTEEIEQIFKDIKIEVQGLDSEAITEVCAEVGAAGGALCAAGAGGSHVLVPLDFDESEKVTKGAEAVTVFWLKDCLQNQSLVPIEYWHRPVRAAPVLNGVVASLSTYCGLERAFLDELAKLLGATTQLRFCRRNTATALASTHLICPTAAGDKYQGALKWGLPAVTAGWLRACEAEGARVHEGPYLVGGTKAPQPPIPEHPEPVSSPGASPKKVVPQKVQELSPDKENAMRPPTSVTKRVESREHTPVGKGAESSQPLSPASRYIAMARQGLLGGDSQGTPKPQPPPDKPQATEYTVRTPPISEALSSPNLRRLSPSTRRRLLALKRGEMPSDPVKTPADPFSTIETPDSAFGAALRPGGRLSPSARKRLWRLVSELPEQPAAALDKGRDQTPLSEIRNRFLAQFNGDTTTDQHGPRKLFLEEQAETPPPAKIAKISAGQSPATFQHPNTFKEPTTPNTTKPANLTNATNTTNVSKLSPAVDAQLQRLSAVLSGLSGQRERRMTRDSLVRPIVQGPVESEAGPESQPNTVGWDDTTPPTAAPAAAASEQEEVPAVKRFMLSSNVDNRDELISMILALGGEVCEGAEGDPLASHLVCAAPGRSEKMLGSVAAGRWVLHPAYVARSHVAGKFLEEEQFEWGNPSASCLPPLSGAERSLAGAAHRWRAARARGEGGAFEGLTALLHVPTARRRLLARLVTAGGGVVVEEDPPYNDDRVTVCFADIKRYPLSDRDAAWLISKNIPVCPPVLLSSYLTDEVPPNPVEHCLPDFRPN